MPKKPIHAGFKRNLLILGGMFAAGIVVILGFVALGSKKTPEQGTTNLSRVIPVAQAGGAEVEMSEATKEALARVETKEAKAARERGETYMPDVSLGRGEKVQVEPAQERPQASPVAASMTPPAPAPARQAQQAQSQTANAEAQRERQEILAGLLAQVKAASTALEPAATQVVALDMTRDLIAKEDAQAQRASQQSASGGQGASAKAAAKGAKLADANQIVPAVLLTPINSDKSTFALVEVTGGPLKGATMRGQVKPMNMSGDVEDVGVMISSMSLNGKSYQVNAMALNEQTATDAMNGDVDRHVFSRYVMPIIMAGFSGAATYFTAKGTPSSSRALDPGSGNSVVVDQPQTTSEQARNQGIGKAVDKTVQVGENIVSKAASRPNSVEVPAFTPIGVIFNAPVYEGSAL